MSRRDNLSSVARFNSRETRPGLSERDYRAAREREYGRDVGNGFPNDTAKRGWDNYKSKQYTETDAKNAYYRDEGRSRAYVERLQDEEEQKYYRKQSAGITPRDHRNLAPKAGRWEDEARNHASAREDLYKREPYMYHSSSSRKEHYGHIEDSYGRQDAARKRREDHERYSSVDDYPRRDRYGR